MRNWYGLEAWTPANRLVGSNCESADAKTA
nr:MAG TPA: hypothetical protein [Inoviridae sp.]